MALDWLAPFCKREKPFPIKTSPLSMWGPECKILYRLAAKIFNNATYQQISVAPSVSARLRTMPSL